MNIFPMSSPRPCFAGSKEVLDNGVESMRWLPKEGISLLHLFQGLAHLAVLTVVMNPNVLDDSKHEYMRELSFRLALPTSSYADAPIG